MVWSLYPLFVLCYSKNTKNTKSPLLCHAYGEAEKIEKWMRARNDVRSLRKQTPFSMYCFAFSHAGKKTLVPRKVDFPKVLRRISYGAGTKDFSYLISANFTDPKMGRCAWTNQSSSQGPLGIKLSLTSTKCIETWLEVDCGVEGVEWPNTTHKLVIVWYVTL